MESAALPVLATVKTVATIEIRKLKPAELFMISSILNINNSWKKLMAIILKEGSENEFHVDHIEQASRDQGRNCAVILLDEWGTMGRKRPTVKILLDLLLKEELRRAVDYGNHMQINSTQPDSAFI